jgi:hypothetical protein
MTSRLRGSGPGYIGHRKSEHIAGLQANSHGDLAKAAPEIIISTVALVILWAEAFWHL